MVMEHIDQLILKVLNDRAERPGVVPEIPPTHFGGTSSSKPHPFARVRLLSFRSRARQLVKDAAWNQSALPPN